MVRLHLRSAGEGLRGFESHPPHFFISQYQNKTEYCQNPMAGQNKGKTETIKDRLICVYLLSEEMAEYSKSVTGKAGLSISKFVMESGENSLKKEEEE